MAWVIYRFSKKCESVTQITNFWKIFFFFKDMTWQRLQMSDWQSWAKSQVQRIEPGQATVTLSLTSVGFISLLLLSCSCGHWT